MPHVILLKSILKQRTPLVEAKDAIKTSIRWQVDGTRSQSGKLDNSAETLKGVQSTTASINTTMMSFRKLGSWGTTLITMNLAPTANMTIRGTPIRFHTSEGFSMMYHILMVTKMFWK
jgi:hypothetical protein